MYDKELDILTLSKGKKVRESVDVGNFIVDIDYDGRVAGVEILDASDSLDLSAETLAGLKDARMSVKYKPDHITIILHLKEKEVRLPFAFESKVAVA